MKITVEDLPTGEEAQITIRCSALSEDLLRLIYKLKSKEHAILGYAGEEIRRISPENAYYFESVDNKVFLAHSK